MSLSPDNGWDQRAAGVDNDFTRILTTAAPLHPMVTPLSWERFDCKPRKIVQQQIVLNGCRSCRITAAVIPIDCSPDNDFIRMKACDRSIQNESQLIEGIGIIGLR